MTHADPDSTVPRPPQDNFDGDSPHSAPQPNEAHLNFGEQSPWRGGGHAFPGATGEPSTASGIVRDLRPSADGVGAPLHSIWNKYGDKIGDWLDSRVEAANSAHSPGRALNGIVVHRPAPPMSAHSFRAMTWLVALFIGLPALLTLGILLYNYWVWYNTPILRTLTDSGLTFWTVLGFGIVSTSIVVVFSGKSPYQSESLRTAFTAYYLVIAALALVTGVEIVSLLSTAPPELVELIFTGSIAAAAAFVAVLLLVVLPFLPDSSEYFTRRRLFDQTVRRIHRGELTRDQARSNAVPPPSPPTTVTKPPQMRSLYVLVAALAAILLVRNAVQALYVLRAADEGTEVSAAVTLPATSPELLITVPFLVVLIWATIGISALAGSVLGRTLFTAHLLAAAFFGFWATLDPQAGSYGLGQTVLGTASPVFTSLSGLVIGIISSTLLFTFYRPEVNRYYREMFLKRHSPEQHKDDIDDEISALQTHRPAAPPNRPGPWNPPPRTQTGEAT